MMPIVNGLEEEFGERIVFLYMNAADGAEGQQAFESLSLPGHPSYILFAPDGSEKYRSFGLREAERLRDVLNASLATPTP